jgi:hypothetical protein
MFRAIMVLRLGHRQIPPGPPFAKGGDIDGEAPFSKVLPLFPFSPFSRVFSFLLPLYQRGIKGDLSGFQTCFGLSWYCDWGIGKSPLAPLFQRGDMERPPFSKGGIWRGLFSPSPSLIKVSLLLPLYQRGRKGDLSGFQMSKDYLQYSLEVLENLSVGKS